ncbi:MAG: hypothetical protein WD651_02465 [Acidimicrobiia bacterium]
MTLVVKELGRHDLARLSEIDRSEEVRLHYQMVGTELMAEAVIDPVPSFFAEGDHHSIPELVQEWQPVVDAGGLLLGAFKGRRQVGIALLGTGVYQLALLFVSRSHRRSGVAGVLIDKIER